MNKRYAIIHTKTGEDFAPSKDNEADAIAVVRGLGNWNIVCHVLDTETNSIVFQAQAYNTYNKMPKQLKPED